MSESTEQPEAPAVKTGMLADAGKTVANSALTAAMTAAMLFGGQQILAPPGPIGPTPTPAPAVTDFGQSVVEAFARDGGSPEEAIIRGSVWASFGDVVYRDGSEQQPALTTGRALGEAAGRCQRYAGIDRAGYDATWGLVSSALNEHVGGGPLDETRRANAAKIYREAGNALVEWGQK